MLIALLHSPSSPYYWAFVAAITLAFAVVDLEALRRRSMSRFHGVSVAIYVLVWVIVLGLSLPIAPLGSLWWVFPAAVRVAVAATFFGGQLLAAAIRGEQRIAHPERREPTPPSPTISEAELREGEEYDAQWQLEDRERNREHEHVREERAWRKRHHGSRR